MGHKGIVIFSSAYLLEYVMNALYWTLVLILLFSLVKEAYAIGAGDSKSYSLVLIIKELIYWYISI
jgi:hypothetical protein